MESFENYDESIKCADSAVKLMKEKHICLYPRNFAIWYAYFSGKYPDLSKVLDKFLNDKSTFSEDRNTLLYQKFFGFDKLGRIIREVTSGANKVLSEALINVQNLCVESRAARKDIDDCCARLEKNRNTGQIKKLVSELLDRVRRLEDASSKIEDRLNENFRKIGDLHRSIEESQRESMTDALTGMANRKLFDACLRLTTEDSRKSASLCIIMMDVDNFKNFNKTRGFDIGDKALKAIAKAISETVKGRDLAARYGDDEFAVLATRTMLSDAANLARNLRGAIGVGSRAIDVEVDNGVNDRITLSIGVAQYEQGESLNRFLARGKSALGAAKANGRNQVVAAEKTNQGIMMWDEEHVIINPLGGQ